jgi:hypothetical protein
MSSVRAILPSRSHPLHPPVGGPESSPAVSVPTPARAASGRRRDWRRDASPDVAAPRTWRTAPSAKRTRRRTPSPLHNPSTARIARPPRRHLLREGWTPGAFDGTVIHGERVLQYRSPRRLGCTRPGPSPTPTRALYVVIAVDGDDDVGGSVSRTFVRIPRNATRADSVSHPTRLDVSSARARPRRAWWISKPHAADARNDAPALDRGGRPERAGSGSVVRDRALASGKPRVTTETQSARRARR